MNASKFKPSSIITGLSRMLDGVFLSSIALFFLVFAGTAEAATTTPNKTQKNSVRVMKASFSDILNQDSLTIDWRGNVAELHFTLPEREYYNSLDLFLSASPRGNVSKSVPLKITYNGGKAIPLYGNRSRFDAQIRLDASRIRPSRNRVKIEFAAPQSDQCLLPHHGQWTVDLKKTKIVARARRKPRNFYINEVQNRMMNPLSAPRTVALIARGGEKTALQALAAQGVAQRLERLPALKLSGAADLKIILGTRSKIAPLVRDTEMLAKPGAEIFVDSGPQERIVITGDSDSDVVSHARLFATNHLPAVRRRYVSAHELHTARSLDKPQLKLGSQKLNSLGVPSFVPGWRPGTAKLEFNAPSGSSAGLMTLKLLRSNLVPPTSKLRASLNGQTLGFTFLDKAKKKVTFDIPGGVLRPTGNRLEFASEFEMPVGLDCTASKTTPAVMISRASKIETFASAQSSGLSALSTGHSPHTIALTARTNRDKIAGLNLLAFAAQQTGPFLAAANYVPSLNTDAMPGDVMIIGPNALASSDIKSAAPPAALSAVRGTKVVGGNIGGAQAARRGRSARLGKIGHGGIGTQFQSPVSGGLITVLTSSRRDNFVQSMRSLAKPAAWNALDGTVMRWDGRRSAVVQINKPSLAAQIKRPFYARALASLSKAGSKISAFEPNFSVPKFSMPAFLKKETPPLQATSKPAKRALASAEPSRPQKETLAVLRGIGDAPKAAKTEAPTVRAPITETTSSAYNVKMAKPNVSKVSQIALPEITAPKLSIPQFSAPDLTAMKAKIKTAVSKVLPKNMDLLSPANAKTQIQTIAETRAVYLGLIFILGLILLALARPKMKR